MVPFDQFAINIGLAFLLGALIGIEREYHSKDIGMRTSALVALGSAIFAMASRNWDNSGAVAGNIITGIGFLGAGSIVRNGEHVKGLTTAAGLWATASIGMLAGIGLHKYAVLAAIAILVVNGVLLVIDRSLKSSAPEPPPEQTPPHP